MLRCARQPLYSRSQMRHPAPTSDRRDSPLVELLRPAWRALRRVPALAWLLTHAPRGLTGWLLARCAELRVLEGEGLIAAGPKERAFRAALRDLLDRHPPEAIGDYLEFGVYGGASLAGMYRALQANGLDGVRLFGFDSFAGLPEQAGEWESGATWQAGEMAMDERVTRRYLTGAGVDWGRVRLVRGWFADTLTPGLVQDLGLAKASLIMIDCDLYSSARDALAFCAGLIRDEAIVFLDDLHFDGLAERGLGEKRAFDELLRAHPDLRTVSLGRMHVHGEMFRVTRAAPPDERTRPPDPAPAP